ncbi:hypothetical protein [Streptomyces sp. NL15-2K]|uniref:hypothetical protein n=1 Tax=Streptomyces sp. NL15-2K TaxID=376149 RepID=UPI002680379A|nr:hypothetical protein [Kutzneria buriramensis]WKX15933.1 hypothetical protein Q4V64_54010 [Kutzneria buriramensis]
MPRLIVAVDEANTTLRQLARCWETFRQKDDPKTSPAITALEEALWLGRAARVHVIFDGRPQAAVLAGAAHEFATVILARFTADTWRRLAPNDSRSRPQAAPPPAGPLPRRPARRRPRGAGDPDDARLVALVRAGARCERGHLVERPETLAA